MFEYRKTTPDELECLWDMNIADNAGDARWVAWKQEYLSYNQSGMAATFAVVCDGLPIGEGTLLFSPDCGAIRGRTALADGKFIANVNALRIRKAYEGHGHVSAMMRRLEQYAARLGYTRLTIGVEARGARNLGIYLHWGYQDFVMSEMEDGELVLYYAKDLKSSLRQDQNDNNIIRRKTDEPFTIFQKHSGSGHKRDRDLQHGAHNRLYEPRCLRKIRQAWRCGARGKKLIGLP